MATVIYQRISLSVQEWFGAYKLFPPKRRKISTFFFFFFLFSIKQKMSQASGHIGNRIAQKVVSKEFRNYLMR
jgi:hypothetical protein